MGWTLGNLVREHFNHGSDRISRIRKYKNPDDVLENYRIPRQRRVRAHPDAAAAHGTDKSHSADDHRRIVNICCESPAAFRVTRPTSRQNADSVHGKDGRARKRKGEGRLEE